MKHYIGTKTIKAKPMNLQDYNDYRGWDLPPDETGTEQGYLVEYLDSPNRVHQNHENYISWSPKDVFEKAYMPMLSSNGTKITEKMVNDFIDKIESFKVGDKTTLVHVKLKNGFTITEASSCVDPASYDKELGREICMKKVKDKIWFLLGFLLQTAINGVK